ncbi:hypothetical protein [Yinghuangia soli]|uniref:Uncharacterized protein n=1 Tax=Yinghuangia soli TaxID=2908204 RepID=A0AA41U2F7_9ACTN|nr:hypothetical protein [Yinghuangia soli]MCF2531748.1 hypothetical protein [Yinghuangia soli]
MLMVTRVPAALLVDTVSVTPYTGEGSHGPQYGTSAAVACLLTERTQLVRAPDGREVTSGASYITTPDHAPPPGSLVTLPGGRQTTVITVQRVGQGLPVPANSEVMLQ